MKIKVFDTEDGLGARNLELFLAGPIKVIGVDTTAACDRENGYGLCHFVTVSYEDVVVEDMEMRGDWDDYDEEAGS